MDESDHAEDFLLQLKHIEHLAYRIPRNPNIGNMIWKNANLAERSGIRLMVAIVKFFNSALQYFSQRHIGNFPNSLQYIHVISTFRQIPLES